MTMKTHWQAEIYHLGELYDIDFPHREMEADAMADALERLTSFTEREREDMTGGVAEFVEVGVESWKSTGNYRGVVED